jgi:hypothetical protein
MLFWIPGPGSASVHVDLMQAQVPDATTLAKMRHSLKARGTRQGLCFTPELRSLKRQGSRRGAAPRGAVRLETACFVHASCAKPWQATHTNYRRA